MQKVYRLLMVWSIPVLLSVISIFYAGHWRQEHARAVNKSQHHHKIQEAYRELGVSMLMKVDETLTIERAQSYLDNVALGVFMRFEETGEKPNGEW